MKTSASCVILSLLILVTIMIVCIMVKYATDISMEDIKHSDDGATGLMFARSMGIIALSDKENIDEYASRFPYVAAIVRNSSSTWAFGCFGSVILVKWVVASAHCRKSGSIHRVLLYHDFAQNLSHTYPILLWRLHENYTSNVRSPKFDIAVAKIKLQRYSFSMKTSGFEEGVIKDGDVAVWKTVSTMDKQLFLTNDLEKYAVKVAPEKKCFDAFDITIDESLICVDLTGHSDCFTHDFGPLFSGDKLVGLILLRPQECDDKYAVFTNVSFYTTWILKVTRTTVY